MVATFTRQTMENAAEAITKLLEARIAKCGGTMPPQSWLMTELCLWSKTHTSKGIEWGSPWEEKLANKAYVAWNS